MRRGSGGQRRRHALARGGRGGDRGAQGDLAPGRGRRGRQDRRRRGHPRPDPRRVLPRPDPAHGPRPPRGPAHRGGAGVPAARRLPRAGDVPHDRGVRGPADGPLHLRLAPRAREHRVPGREGQRDPARDRADPDLQREGRGRGHVRARALRHPAAHREGGHRRAGRGPLPRVAVVPGRDLQGDDAGRAGLRVLPRPARRALRERLRDLPPALLDQHVPAMVARAAVPDARA